MDSESEGVNDPRVLHGAGRLEERGGVWRGKAAGSEQDDSGSLGLLLLGEVEEDPYDQLIILKGEFTQSVLRGVICRKGRSHRAYYAA